MRETALDPALSGIQTAASIVGELALTPLADPTPLAWDKMGGLLPVVVQDAETLQVLMLGYMNQAALDESMLTGKVTFYSRSKQRLWQKGETSGHYLQLVDITPDCDGDCLLARVKPAGPVCHRNTISCFGTEDAPGLGLLARLVQIIQQRQEMRPEGSYTVQLLDAGTRRIAQKIGEEGVEVALAATCQEPNDLNNELADLLYHILVLLCHKTIPLTDCLDVMRQRMLDYGGTA